MKRVLVMCLLTVSAVSAPVLAGHSHKDPTEVTGVKHGAQFAMHKPGAWNGRLVLYAHGFVDPAAPIALPDVAPPDVASWFVELRDILLDAGYAVAYSSYAENGWAVKDGARRTHELREIFMDRLGVPSHVYVMGRSLGALITLMLAETHPGSYQGALALCGPVGGGRLETDYIANVRVLFDHFYPEVISGDVLHVPPLDFSPNSPLVGAIVGTVAADMPSAVALASIDQVQLPYTTPGELINSILRALSYNILGANDLLARTRGRSPFGNIGTKYTAGGVFLKTLNENVERFAAERKGLRFLEAFYQPRGDLMIPLLTLHTTLDPDVPFFHEPALAKIVAEAKRSRWLAQQSVQRYGHCNFSPAEVALTFSRLVAWAEDDVKPVSGDVTADFAAAVPADTARSMATPTASEFTVTIDEILGTTELPLP